MVFFPLVITLIVIGFSFLYWKYYKASILLSNVSGPRGLPIVGNALEVAMQGNLADNIVPYLGRLVRKYGSRTKLYLGWNPTLILANAEDIQRILSSNLLINKGPSYKLAEEVSGRCLATVDDDEWIRKRKLAMSSFSFQMLKNFVEVMDKQSRMFVEILRKKSKENNQLDVAPLISDCALDIIIETSMGCQMGLQTGNDRTYSEAFHEICLLLVKRWFNPLLQWDPIWTNTADYKKWNIYKQTLRAINEKIISERKEGRLSEASNGLSNNSDLLMGKKHKAFLDNLLEQQEANNAGITDEEILAETNLFVVAGYDTVSSVVQFLLLRIGYHLDVQKKMQEEIDAIYGSAMERSLTSNDLRHLEYTEMVIKEVMRLHPVLPLIQRYLTSPLNLDSSTTIPKGVTVFVLIDALHKDPNVYPNPDEFCPERFSTDKITKRHPYAYAPFSLGPRNCPGSKFAMMEMKMMIAHTLRHFNVRSVPKTNQFAVQYTLTSYPKGGVQVEMIPRNEKV